MTFSQGAKRDEEQEQAIRSVMDRFKEQTDRVDEYEVDVIGGARAYAMESTPGVITLGQSAAAVLVETKSEHSLLEVAEAQDAALAFVLAHELGHWLRSDSKTTPPRTKLDVETRADEFALELVRRSRILPEPKALLAAATVIEKAPATEGTNAAERCILEVELRLRALAVEKLLNEHVGPVVTSAERDERASDGNRINAERAALRKPLDTCAASLRTGPEASASDQLLAARIEHVRTPVDSAAKEPPIRANDKRYDAPFSRWRDDAGGLIAVGGGVWRPVKSQMDPDIGPFVSLRIGLPFLTRGFATMAGADDPGQSAVMATLFGAYGQTNASVSQAGATVAGTLRSWRFGIDGFVHYPGNTWWLIGVGGSAGALRDDYSGGLTSLSRWSPYFSWELMAGFQLGKRTHLMLQFFTTLAFDGFISLDRGDIGMPVTFKQFFW